jgi:hypothetical protein
MFVWRNGFRLSFCEGGLQERDLLAALQAAEAFGSLQHGSAGPATGTQSHLLGPPIQTKSSPQSDAGTKR